MGHGTHKKMSYEIQSTNDKKNAQKHVKEIKKCQENIKICNIFGELLSNGVLPC